MDSLEELMDLAEIYVGPVIDELPCRLLERDYVQYDTEVVILAAILTNILGHDNHGDAPRKSY